MKNKLLFCTLFLITIYSIGKAQPILGPLSGPSPQSFNKGSDKLGDVSSSVNLFTGDVAFPMPLASIAGRNGLDASVSISYNSNVDKQATTWNADAPTGVVGLGWSLDFPKIVVDNKMTGTREDDTYYVSEGGGMNELAYVGISGGIKQYKPKNHQFWSISYDATNDKWEIIKEDGSRYVYGDKNSGRSTIQWLVSWNNWIGSSNVISSSIQKQQALVWNLSEIKNIWGEGLRFAYSNINQSVGGAGGKEHTEASYLSSITNVFNQSINLVYGTKTAAEYVEPHTENGANQIDAFQERYERSFLDYLTVNDSDGGLLSKVDLNYSLMGTGDLTKRLLTSIVQYNPQDQSLPGYTFSYVTSGANVNLGAMSTMTMPTGGTISYTYSNQTITRAVREKKVDAIAGYAEPKVWMGPDYVIVTRRQLDASGEHAAYARNVLVQVFTWDGEWVEWNLGQVSIPDVLMIDDLNDDDVTNLADQTTDYQKFHLTLQSDFFAIAYRTPGGLGNTLKIFKKDVRGKGRWHSGYEYTDSNTDGLLRKNYSLVSGEKFVAFSHYNEQINVFTWNGEDWLRKELDGRIIGRPHNSIVAGHNYIISHRRSLPLNPSYQDEIRFYFLKEDGTWIDRVAPQLPDPTTVVKSNWFPAATFAVTIANSNADHIYSWDENYNIQTPFNTTLTIPDASFVDVVNQSMVGILTYEGSPRGFSFRYNGQTWIAGGQTDYSGIAIDVRALQSYGDDFIVRPRPNGNVGLQTFNPNTGLWSNSDYATANRYLLFAGNSYFVAVDQTDLTKARLYSKKQNGSFVIDPVAFSGLQKTDGLVTGSNEARFAWQGGYDFVVKSRNTSSENAGLLQSIKFKNGRIDASSIGLKTTYSDVLNSTTRTINDNDPVIYEVDYWDPTRTLSNGSTLVTFLSGSISGSLKAYQKSATELRLHRIIGAEAIGYLTDYPVMTVVTNDGESNASNYLLFNNTTATYDPSGSTAQYNSVTVYPGVSYQNNANGFITNRFFNGITNAEAGNTFPVGPINYEVYSNFVKGLSYQSETFNSSSSSVSKTINAPIVLDKSIVCSRVDNGLTVTFGVGKAYYVRNHTGVQTVDNLSTTTEVVTNTTNGLPSTQTITYLGKTVEQVVQNYKYWYQEHDIYRSKNVLTPVIQSKTTVDGVVVGCEVVKYKNWGANSVPFPWKTYSWTRTGASDFSSWAESSDPSSDWRLTNTVDIMDEISGLVKQTTDFAGNKKSVVWHSSSPYPMAEVSMAGASEIYYEGFEYNPSASTVDAKTGVKSYGASFLVTLPSAGTYRLTYWQKVGAGTWQLVESTISGNTTIGAAGTLIDEVRLHPANADMTSRAYDKYRNVITECDANNVIIYKEYDEFQRPKLIRDKDRNIIKHTTYTVKK